jgi:hypothetical protein
MSINFCQTLCRCRPQGLACRHVSCVCVPSAPSVFLFCKASGQSALLCTFYRCSCSVLFCYRFLKESRHIPPPPPPCSFPSLRTCMHTQHVHVPRTPGAQAEAAMHEPPRVPVPQSSRACTRFLECLIARSQGRLSCSQRTCLGACARCRGAPGGRPQGVGSVND